MAKYYLNNELIDTTPELDAKLAELDAAAKSIKDSEADAKIEKDNLKASAKAKLIAGEALTQEEADTIVL